MFNLPILYRAKPTETTENYSKNEWEFSSHAEHYSNKNNIAAIEDSWTFNFTGIDNIIIPINIKTIGISTGIKDINGNKIFSGDFLYSNELPDFYFIVIFHQGVLKAINENELNTCITFDKKYLENIPALNQQWIYDMKKIIAGNFIDNPEIMSKNYNLLSDIIQF